MSQGNDFANYSAASNAASGGSDEVWFVAVASDDIKQMTIDQLDEAFRLGVITGETPVWTEGMEAWAPLGQVADLDGDSGSEAGAQEEAVASPQQGAGPGNTGTFGAGTGAAFGAVTMQSAQHSFAPGPSSMAPVTSSYAPSSIGQSSVPVALGDEELPAKRRAGFRPARWALAGAAAVIAVGVIAYNNLSSSVASAGTEAEAPTALAARPYDGADGVERGTSTSGTSSSGTAATGAQAASPAAQGQAEEGAGVAAVAAAAATTTAATTAKAALMASDEAGEEAPASGSKKAADRDSLKSSFSKSLTKKASAKAGRTKPRKASTRAAAKARAKPKKSTVVRSQSAFDPLNDSLP